jgi:hypothetical protein
MRSEELFRQPSFHFFCRLRETLGELPHKKALSRRVLNEAGRLREQAPGGKCRRGLLRAKTALSARDDSAVIRMVCSFIGEPNYAESPVRTVCIGNTPFSVCYGGTNSLAYMGITSFLQIMLHAPAD